MPLNVHDASVGVFVRGLTSLKVLLTKGEAHAQAAGIDPADLLGTELAPGMYNLAVQVHWAAQGAQIAVERLMGATAAPPVTADPAKSFAELHGRVDAALAYLGSVDGAELLGAELAPGMYNLAVQVHWAAEGARDAPVHLKHSPPTVRSTDDEAGRGVPRRSAVMDLSSAGSCSTRSHSLMTESINESSKRGFESSKNHSDSRK
jgi:hypothetical protein